MIIYEEVFKEFQKHKINYVLVGGLAFNLLGGMRATSDLDILVAMTDDNLRKIVKILKNKGYGVKQPVDPMDIANESLRKDWIKNKNMKAFNFYKDDGIHEVDIIIDSPVSFYKAKKNAIIISVGKLKLPVISVDDLITMKKRAGRDIDRLDINQLMEIKKYRKKYAL